MIRFYILILFLFSCTDLLINSLEYHSVELKGNAWIEINQGTNFNTNDFTLQSWFSGSDTTLNKTQTKQENYELIVAIKQKGKLKKMEILFNARGEVLNRRDILRRSYDFLIF